MGVSLALDAYPRDVFQLVMDNGDLQRLLIIGVEKIRDLEPCVADDLVRGFPKLFRCARDVYDSVTRLESMLEKSRDGWSRAHVFFQKSQGVFRFLLERAIMARYGVDSSRVLGKVLYGEHSLDPNSDESPGYIAAQEVACLTKWLRDMNPDALGREFDGPEMERVQAYRMREWDAGRPRSMPERWFSDVAKELQEFREFVVSAVERQAIIVSRLG